ncbi:MAG: cob(I)yrinic acid a,c-diamide adenosyltransferase [Planctomycetota bacterium]|jgi:cob(I)alamin adenosyltransferase
MLEKGLVQIYTGNGKGKTTAALGLALRAAGHGAKVLIYQFLKPSNLPLGERGLLNAHCEGITIRWLDEPWDMFQSMKDQQELQRVRDSIHTVMQEMETAAHEKYYDLIVLDEIVFCLGEGLASMDDIKELIEHRDPRVELVLTGRGASDELIELADLVTEMRPVKHPYDNGTAARKGIEY